MEMQELLFAEFDDEMKLTRTLLERVPENKPEFKPHEKSMPLGKLAAHVAQLPDFARIIAQSPGLDFSSGSVKPLVMESRSQLLTAFDDVVRGARQAIAAAAEDEWRKPWKLSFQGKAIMEGSRHQVYRKLFLNHLIHHRAQLGVYLRMNNVPLPATYGPSADDSMGF